MNPKHVRIRMDRHTGELWLCEERYRQPIKKVANVTSDVLLAFCADLSSEEGTAAVEREVLFKEEDGKRWGARITIEAFDV